MANTKMSLNSKIKLLSVSIFLSGVVETMQGCSPVSSAGNQSSASSGASVNTGPRLTTIDLSTIGSANGSGFTLDGEIPGDEAGSTFANLGDFNGDGIGDFAIGAPRSSAIYQQGGRAYIVFGQSQKRPDGALDSLGSTGFYLSGRTGYNLSLSLSSAGDVNGDGKKDLLLGAPSKGLNQGEAYVIFGKNTSLNLLNNFLPSNFDPTASTFPANGGYKMTPPSTFGLGVAKSISGGGDFDGDGYDDTVVGGPFIDTDGTGPSENQGQVYISFGKPSAFTNQSLTGALSPVSGGINLNGTINAGIAGRSVAILKDFNGDGFSDVAISAPGINTVYLVFGNSSKAAYDNLDLDSLNGANGGVKIFGPAGIDFGNEVESLGDINGDGLTDLIINAPTANHIAGTNNYMGGAYILFGTPTPASLQNVNVTSLNGTNGFSVKGANLSTTQLFGFSRYGGFSDVAGVGDLNNDGFDDIAICQPGTPMGTEQVGETFILFGHSGSFAATNGLNLDTGLNGVNGLKIVGSTHSINSATGAPDIRPSEQQRIVGTMDRYEYKISCHGGVCHNGNFYLKWEAGDKLGGYEGPSPVPYTSLIVPFAIAEGQQPRVEAQINKVFVTVQNNMPTFWGDVKKVIHEIFR